MLTKFVSLILAISLVVTLGVFIPLAIDHFNDNTFSNITILDTPTLLEALQQVQDRGIYMCIHGWRHEDFSTLTAQQALDAVEKSLEVFRKANLVPAAFIPPYQDFSTLPPSVRAAIESTGIATSLPVLKSNGTRVAGYGWLWRTMKSFEDNRYRAAAASIISEQPTSIYLHVEDWNPFLKQLMCDYLQETQVVNVTIRIDDIEVNTPVEKIIDMADLLNYTSVGRVAYSIIPSGTWRGGDPTIYGISVNNIFHSYWFFFLATAFFPFAFLFLWRGMSSRNRGGGKTDGNHASDDPPAKPPEGGQLVSVVVPAYNEEENIGRCIESILTQDFTGELELIVVNDGSTDRTSEIASKYPVKLIDLPKNGGKAQALNVGTRSARGEIIVFSDSDSEMSHGALTSISKCFEDDPDVEAVAGNVLVKTSDGKHSFLGDFQEIEYLLEQEVSRFLQSSEGKVLVCPGPLFAVKRRIAEKTPFSSVTVVEDADFTLCVLKEHSKIVRVSEAMVYTDVPKSIRAWLNQRKRWWYGNLQLWKKHGEWARRNPWMILNYLAFPISILSILMTILLPYLFSTFDNLNMILLRGILYLVTPWVLFTLFTWPFFVKKNRKLLFMLVPYYLIYATMKMLLIAYLYICYLSRRGVVIRFGSKDMRVR